MHSACSPLTCGSRCCTFKQQSQGLLSASRNEQVTCPHILCDLCADSSSRSMDGWVRCIPANTTRGVLLVCDAADTDMVRSAGLDARAAAIVMKSVKKTVQTGRTVVCTIHQPSMDIFRVRIITHDLPSASQHPDCPCVYSRLKLLHVSVLINLEPHTLDNTELLLSRCGVTSVISSVQQVCYNYDALPHRRPCIPPQSATKFKLLCYKIGCHLSV